MEKIDDEKVLFFLRNQKQIEEWSRIKDEVVFPLADKFFESVERKLHGRKDTIVGKPEVHAPRDTNPQQLMLYKKNWPVSQENPRVSVGLEWKRKNTDFQHGYIGVWTDSSSLFGVLHEQLKSIDLFIGGSWKSERFWPMWRYEEPKETNDYWNHLSRFQEQILDDIEELWRQAAPVIDHSVKVTKA